MQSTSDENRSLPDRLERGFHRIGATLLALCVIFGFALSAREVWWHLKWSEDLSQIGHWLLDANMRTVLVGIFFYGICRALGWIVVGFTRK